MIGKLLERAMMGQFSQFLNENKLINKNHHGGRGDHSTTSCLLEITEEVIEAQENKLCAALLATDLSSAYDLCNHLILKERCRLLSIGQDGLNWLSSFLSGRTQYVEIGGSTSEVLEAGNIGVI